MMRVLIVVGRVRVAHQRARVDAALGERVEHLLRVRVVADHAHQHRLGAERGEVRGHVAGAAERAGLALRSPPPGTGASGEMRSQRPQR